VKITTAQLTVTAEDLTGLTCSSCQDPATHTVELVMGNDVESAAVVRRYVCQVDAVIALGNLATELSPNLWAHYGDTIAAMSLRAAETVESRRAGHGSAL
jgi:hypothetical protein